MAANARIEITKVTTLRNVTAPINRLSRIVVSIIYQVFLLAVFDFSV
jgi:hypothetical protein